MNPNAAAEDSTAVKGGLELSAVEFGNQAMVFINKYPTMKYIVITTFNQSGYNQYGSRMIETFLSNWPKEIELLVYAENCLVTQTAPNLTVINQSESCPDLQIFKQRWHGVPKANGDVTNDPVRSKRKDAGKGFKWDAVRFSHKVYSIFHAAKNTNADWLIWMDADMVCHSPLELSFIQHMCPNNYDLCFLGRVGKYSECGLYAVNLKTKSGQLFLKQFQDFYDQDIIFNFDEWHDSFVFDEVRRSLSLKELDWSQGIIKGEGHPIINSAWGAYLDHLKGKRKESGKSFRQDLKIHRNEQYWQNL